jgi:hypothetical protein
VAIVQQQLLAPDVADDRIEVAIAVDVAEVGLGTVGDGRRESYCALIDECAAAGIDQELIRSSRDRVGAIGFEKVEIAVPIDVDQIDIRRRCSGRTRSAGSRLSSTNTKFCPCPSSAADEISKKRMAEAVTTRRIRPPRRARGGL